MADKSTIKIKRSSTSIAPALLNTGELAYTFGTASDANMGGRLFVGGMGANSDLLSAAGAPIVIGGKYFTDIIDAATSAGTIGTLVKRDGTNMAYLNITGNVKSTGLSEFSNAAITGGSINGTIIGATTAAAITGTTINGTVITASTNFAGDLKGDIYAANGTSKILEAGTDGTNAVFTGAVTGAITGAVTGNVTGDIYAADGTSKILENGTDGTNAVFTGGVVGNASTATKWASPINITFQGDASTSAISIDGSQSKTPTITLTTLLDGSLGKIEGSYGSATKIPVVSVNTKGLVTGITTVNVATSLKFRGDNASTIGTLSLLDDNLRIVGSGGVTTSVDDATNTITVAMSGTGSLGALSVTGEVAAGTISVTGSLEAGSLEAASIQVNGNAIITGDLEVRGTVTTINSATVSIGDLNIELAKDASSAGAANGGGITINGPTIPATLTYSSGDNRWNFNKDLNVNNVYGNLVGNADTATKWAAGVDLSLTGDATATLTAVDGSGTKSATLTLALVNPTTYGSYGTSLTVPQITVNNKGLITSVVNQNIPNASTSAKGLAWFDIESFGVNAATGFVTLATVDGGTY